MNSQIIVIGKGVFLFAWGSLNIFNFCLSKLFIKCPTEVL